MKDNDGTLCKFYEQGMEILNREIELLYQRMNFFLTGISFLVAAFATMLALKRSLVIPIYAVTSLGLILSFLFTLANSLSGRAINERQAYICSVEKELNSHTVFGGPNNDIASLESSRKSNCINRIFSCLFHGHPAVITLIVPELFIGFWSVMLVYLSLHQWYSMLIIGIAVFIVLFCIIHQHWRPWDKNRARPKSQKQGSPCE